MVFFCCLLWFAPICLLTIIYFYYIIYLQLKNIAMKKTRGMIFFSKKEGEYLTIVCSGLCLDLDTAIKSGSRLLSFIVEGETEKIEMWRKDPKRVDGPQLIFIN